MKDASKETKQARELAEKYRNLYCQMLATSSRGLDVYKEKYILPWERINNKKKC